MQHTARTNFNSSLDSELSCLGLIHFSYVSCRQTQIRKATSYSNHCLCVIVRVGVYAVDII